MTKQLLALVAAGGFAGLAQAGLVVETESNDSFSTANFIGNFTPPGDAVVVDGGIHNLQTGAPDQDWFSFSVSNSADMVLSIYGLPDSTHGDSFVQLYAADGTTVLAQDDDSGLGLFSSFEKQIAAGNYFIRVSASPNATADNRQFDYKMVVGFNVTPAPSTMMLAGLGGLVVGRRRR